MTETQLRIELTEIAGIGPSLYAFVAQYALDQSDPAHFLKHWESTPCDDLPFYASIAGAKKFFETYYGDITDALGDMHAMGQHPAVTFGDLRCTLCEAAFLYTAESIAMDLGLLPDERNAGMGRCDVCRQHKPKSEFSKSDPGACTDCYMSGVRL
jgi:hypothetical protein